MNTTDPNQRGTTMRNGNGYKAGIAAVIGIGMMLVIPTTSNAYSPTGWNHCPAFDTEPICDLVAQHASNGDGTRPSVVEPSTRRGADSVVDISCPSKATTRIVACAE